MTVMLFVALGSTLIGVGVPLLTSSIINGPLASGDRAALWLLGLYALLFGLAEAALILTRRLTLASSVLGIERDLRDDLYEHLQRQDVGFHDSWQSGQLVSRMTSDISSIRRFFGFALIFLVVNGVTFVSVGILLIVIDPLLGGIVVLFGIPLSLIVFRYEKVYRKNIRAVQDQQGEVATDIEESALGIRAIKSFGRRDLFFARYDAKAVKLRTLQLRQIRTLAQIWALIIAQPQTVLALITLFGVAAVASGRMSLGTLVAFVALYQMLVWPIESSGWLLAASQEANTAAERIFEVLDVEPTIREPAATKPPHGSGRLVFENVGFRYPGSDTPLLTDINLALEPGETVAIVGPTGCGKTTLTALVPRLYDVTEGRILIDGVDVRELSLAELRSRVACAFEDPTLFSASVRENLVLGRPDADEEQVAEAIRVAQAGFVQDLPWGLDTRVGEQGMSLSGGQRQRLALARAVLGRPSMLVLDDPLSALDIHTESLVEQALRSVLADTTGLVVAHRPSTVLLADRVVVLGPAADGGTTVVAQGTHHELLETEAVYRDLLSQSSDLEAAR
ncbi:MAG TPA: ABC transporter ATP-binding protein [Actinospica sp.]|jgi:ATP-binding cassette subfamily B protein|nr:ABC transporter ATP-binding protein [Actinospica sp.]